MNIAKFQADLISFILTNDLEKLGRKHPFVFFDNGRYWCTFDGCVMMGIPESNWFLNAQKINGTANVFKNKLDKFYDEHQNSECSTYTGDRIHTVVDTKGRTKNYKVACMHSDQYGDRYINPKFLKYFDKSDFICVPEKQNSILPVVDENSHIIALIAPVRCKELEPANDET